MLEQMMETVRKAVVRGVGVEAKSEQFDSPRLATLVRDVEAGRRAAIEEFWRGVRGNAPLVEAVAGDDATFWVTYLWRADDDPGRLLLIGGVPSDRSKPLSRLAGTDVWYWTERTPRDARCEYGFVAGPSRRGARSRIRYEVSSGGGVRAESRKLRDVLEAKGNTVIYHEFTGGHEYVNSRGSFAAGLLSLAGK